MYESQDNPLIRHLGHSVSYSPHIAELSLFNESYFSAFNRAISVTII